MFFKLFATFRSRTARWTLEATSFVFLIAASPWKVCAQGHRDPRKAAKPG